MQFIKLAFNSSPLHLPKSIRIFLLRLCGLVTAWQLSYIFILKPLRVPDKALTDIITAGVAGCINFFFNTLPHATWAADATTPANLILQRGKNVFYIHDMCNGLDLIVIYLGFILLLPYSLKRKMVFTLCGIPALVAGNIVRCVVLYWIYINHRSMFEVNHHYVFTIMMYLLIFCGWFLFTKKQKVHEVC